MMSKKRIAHLAILIIPVLILIPFMGDFIYPMGSSYSDLAITHFPNAIFLKQVLMAGKGIPLWSPAILGGYPFASDPLSGLWYLPGWLAFLFPLPFGFNLTILFHLLWGGAGMYLILRAQGLKAPASLLGAIIFEAFPKLLAHFAAGHITLVYAVCWTPWLLFAELNQKRSYMTKRFWALPGIILGIIALADVRWAAFAGLLWIGYALFEMRISFKSLIVNIILAVLVSAPVLLPLLQYSQLSTRAAMTPAERFTLSLPPAKLFGLIYPDIGGYAEWVLYPGALTLVLTVTLLLSPDLVKRTRFWLFATIIALVYSLGSNIPLLSNLALLPGFDLLRVPSRALFLLGMTFSVLAATTANYLIDDNQGLSFFRRAKPDLLLTGLAMFAAILAGGIWLLTHSLSLGFGWGAIGILVASILVILRLHYKISGRLCGVAVIVFTLVDLGTVNFLSLQPRTPASVLSEGSAAAAYLSKFTGLFRTYSPSYSIPQQTAALYNLQLADGIDPLQISFYVSFMSKATGIPANGYSVTLPPFSSGNPQKDNEFYLPDARQLGLINVRYIVAAYDLDADGLNLIARIGNTRIYENQFVLPRVWVQPPGSQLGSSILTASIEKYAPNEIDISAQGTGELVLSEVDYPGWEVWVDGKLSQMVRVAGVLRGVNLSNGQHLIRFVFRPWFVYLGITINLISLAGILGATFFARRRDRMGL
jgi:hypothetical protein